MTVPTAQDFADLRAIVEKQAAEISDLQKVNVTLNEKVALADRRMNDFDMKIAAQPAPQPKGAGPEISAQDAAWEALLVEMGYKNKE